ncbi:unnamed protein product, partial [Vitis vinifera]
METPSPREMNRITLLFFFLSLVITLFSAAADHDGPTTSTTSIIFTTLGRSDYAFDVFSLPTLGPSTIADELRITDGQSVNFNGHFPSSPIISLLANQTLRNGSSNIYLDIIYYDTPTNSRRRSALETAVRVEVPLLGTNTEQSDGRISMKDRPSLVGEDLVYVSTHEDSGVPRKMVIERVTPPGLHAFTPATSPGNKNFIAVATRRLNSDYRHIELFDLLSNEFRELTRRISPQTHHFNPFISPDSTRIGYHRCRGDSNGGKSPHLLLENLKSPLPEISLFRFDGSFPSFSPGGDRIAYVEFPGVYVVNRDGSGRREVFSGIAFSTAWDHKRKGVVYTSAGPTFATESTKVDIVSINVDDVDQPSYKKLTTGGGIHRLTEGPWTDTMCNWSPDGDWIVFASDRENPGGGGFELYVIHPNGTGLRKVVHSGSAGRTNHPWFSPDGKSIVFTSDYAAVSAEPISNAHHYQPYGDIFVVNLDGSGLHRLTHNSYEDGTPAWAPKVIRPVDVKLQVDGPHCSFEDCHWLSNTPNHGVEAAPWIGV